MCTYFYNNTKMQKRKGRRPSTNQNLNSEQVGRPRDDRLQSYFMRKLRDGKIQMINAESLAELASDKIKDANPELIAKRKLEGDDDDYSMEKFEMVKQWFKKAYPENYDHLYEVFREAAAKYEYRQIENQNDFPEYLFLDELDLAYILHHVLNSQLPQFKEKTQFSNEELLFFACASFALRDMISFRTISTLELIYDQIITNMDDIKDKIKANYEQSMIERQSAQKSEESSQNQDIQEVLDINHIPADLRKGEVHIMLQQSEKIEKEENLHKENKTKQIDKLFKKKPGRPKNNKPNKQNKTFREEIENFLQKFITYISWSYRYIYPEEVKKKRSLGFLE